MSNSDIQAIESMHRRGGAFARALAHAAAAADPENLAKVKATWPEMWEKYANWQTKEESGQL
jgi:hypothetical protein